MCDCVIQWIEAGPVKVWSSWCLVPEPECWKGSGGTWMSDFLL